MRILPSNPVLHRGPRLKPGIRAGALVVCTIAGCAKFPANNDNTSFTKVSFRMAVARQINQDYQYFVVIRASQSANPDVQGAPVPVFDPSKNPNGFTAGQPTHFVQFMGLNQNIEPFVLYRFALKSEVPVTNDQDPTNPINLAVFSRSTRGVINDFDPVNAGTNANPGTNNTIRFSLFVNLLGDDDATARKLQSLQVQFMTMNTTLATSSRVIDFLGTPTQPNFIQVDLRASGQYGNATGLPGAGIEAAGDCSDPDLDITDWGIQVTHP